MLGHETEQFHVRGPTRGMEGESAAPMGKGGGDLRAAGGSGG